MNFLVAEILDFLHWCLCGCDGNSLFLHKRILIGIADFAIQHVDVDRGKQIVSIFILGILAYPDQIVLTWTEPGQVASQWAF